MTGIIHKFTGDWDRAFSWEGARSRMYRDTDASQISETWMIGKEEGAEHFAFRYYQLSPGSSSNKEHHPYDHGILVMQGAGQALLGQERHAISRGDILYIPPDEVHQIINTGAGPLGFICVIPARREKGGQLVWAEEGIDFSGSAG